MKIMTSEPRIASHKHVLRLDRYVELYTDSGLEMFQNTSKVQALGLLDGCRAGIFQRLARSQRI